MKKILLSLALLVATTLSAEIIHKTIPYEHDGVKFLGYLVYDDEKIKDGPRPGVVVVHEWWGRDDFADKQTHKFALEGYIAFAVDMYGEGKTTRDAKEARELSGKIYGGDLMERRARAGLDALLAIGMVDTKKIAAVGYCFGGAVAQVLAYGGAPLTGVVSVHGGLIPATAEDAKLNHASFLICHGGADTLIPKEELDLFVRSLEDHAIDYQLIVYQGAKHAFSNPAADEFATAAKLTGVGYQRRAAERSWRHTNQFLKEVFKLRRP
ncbi:MAG: dienelactone hydrolase family protein [Opitutaceae bacterium]|nr:dienelactone hydrolase family protein [Opitutaceae bacterium]